MKNLMAIIPLMLFVSSASAKTQKIVAEGIGEFTISTEYVGEPVSRPLYVAVEVTCTDGKKERIFEEQVCDMKQAAFKQETKSLILDTFFADFDHGEVKCRNRSQTKLDVEKICE